MIQSMTGYGEAVCRIGNADVQVMIKTVNGKYLDVECLFPSFFLHQESHWRRLFAEKLKRGRVTCTLSCSVDRLVIDGVLNEELLKSYIKWLKGLSKELAIKSDILSVALQLPGVIKRKAFASSSVEDIAIVNNTIQSALEKCVASREREGAVLAIQLREYLTTLYSQITLMDTYIKEQEETLRKKLDTHLLIEAEENTSAQSVDYSSYLNKVNVEEERVRVKSHIDFFQETLSKERVVGKKLGFIVQELGRELNTIGAKAQHIPLQSLVIEMKEAVECMREQLLNLV